MEKKNEVKEYDLRVAAKSMGVSVEELKKMNALLEQIKEHKEEKNIK